MLARIRTAVEQNWAPESELLTVITSSNPFVCNILDIPGQGAQGGVGEPTAFGAAEAVEAAPRHATVRGVGVGGGAESPDAVQEVDPGLEPAVG